MSKRGDPERLVLQGRKRTVIRQSDVDGFGELEPPDSRGIEFMVKVGIGLALAGIALWVVRVLALR